MVLVALFFLFSQLNDYVVNDLLVEELLLNEDESLQTYS